MDIMMENKGGEGGGVERVFSRSHEMVLHGIPSLHLMQVNPFFHDGAFQ